MADVPNVPIPNIQTGSDTYKPLPFHFSTEPSNYVTGPTTFNTNPELYELDQIALQSGAKDMWNSFIQGINQTQISSSQLGLFTNQKRIAEIEGGLSFKGELSTLESQYLNKQIDEMEYQTRKNLLNRELSILYNQNDKINNDILSDQQDIENAPVKKSYKVREQLLQGMGSDAGLLDSIIYTQPSVMGSSAATMGATLLTAFGANLARKLATKVVGSFSTGPAAPYVATGLALGTMFETLYQARKLESQAEVGGAISEDFELLKAQYLAANPGKKDLTQQEYNELIVQANKGADTQYWKNMSLAGVDAAQAMLLAGSFGRWFETFANANKISRVGSRALGLWLEGKSESVEEGVQYAFQKEKQAVAINNIPNDSTGFWDTVASSKFINGLRQDYVDVLGSINYGPIKGDGKYSGNKEFEFATDSGFLMGILMGGASSTLQSAKDFHNYRKATKELQEAGIEDTEGNIFKFKSDIYKKFFEPTSSLFGILNTQSEDRVHYLREAIKTLGSKKDGNGNTFLTKEEVAQELKNVGEAYRLYDKLSGYTDNISGGFRQSPLLNLAKAKFRDAAFRESMQMVHQRQNLDIAQNNHSTALVNSLTANNPDSDLAANKALLDAVNKRIEHVKNLTLGEDVRNRKVDYLEARRKNLEAEIELQEQNLRDLNIPINTPASPEIIATSESLLTAQMFSEDTVRRYNALLKIKTRKQLEDWFITTATEEAYNGWTEANEAITAVNQQEAQDQINTRSSIDSLSEEEKQKRVKENKDILAVEGFSDATLASMTDEELETSANAVLTARANATPYSDPRTFMNKLSKLRTQQDLEALFDLPGFENWVSSTLPTVKKTSPYKDVATLAKKQLKGKPRPATSTTTMLLGRSKAANDIRTEADFLRALNAKNKFKTGDALLYIKNSVFATEAEKELARRLLETDSEILDRYVLIDSTTPTAGQYNTKKNEVSINFSFIAADYQNANAPFETVILHEVLHQFTLGLVTSNSALFARLNQLYTFVIDQARNKGVFDKYYGLTSPAEMITEGFTSPSFQEFLKGLSYTSENKTAWQVFLDLVNSALKALGITTDQTALDELISVTTQYIERGNRESFDAIKGGIQQELIEKIHTANSEDANIDAAANILQSLYDMEGLIPSEFEILERAVSDRLNQVNSEIKSLNSIKFGPFEIQPGGFIILNENKTIYTVDKKNSNGSLLVTYTYKTKGSKTSKIGSKVINDPAEIDKVFISKKDALDYTAGKPVKSAKTNKSIKKGAQSSVTSYDQALDSFIEYVNNIQNYGTLDPKLLELGNKLISESIKIGRNNFRDISSEIVSRRGEDVYKTIFTNLRRVYSALYADTPGLTDTESEITNLVTGKTTAESVINEINAKPSGVDNPYTGGGTEVEETSLLLANTQDKISGNVFKSTGQQFKTDDRGLWTNEIDNDPVKQRYYNFIDKMLSVTSNGKSMSELGYFGLLIQDGETLPDGTPIPHEQKTINYINSFISQGKQPVYGQVVMIVDKDNKPIKVDQEGNLSDEGDLIVFNIETVKTIEAKPLDIVAATNGITLSQAEQLIKTAAAEVNRIRNLAKDNKPVKLELSVKPGVPVFSETGSSTATLANKNYEIEIASVRKDDTTQGYFVNHPNQTGFLGGAYVFVEGIPVKLEPNQLTDQTADLIIAILDQQASGTLSTAEVKNRTKFLNDLVFQRFSKDQKKGTFYFRSSDVYVDGIKISKDQRKAAILANGRYNISSKLLNNNWSPYMLKDGKIVKTKPVSYNSYILNRSTTKAVLQNGDRVLANSYFNYKIGNTLESWLPKAAKAVNKEVKLTTAPVSSNLSKSYKSKLKEGDLIIPLKEFIDNLDFDETAILGFEDYIQDAEEIRLVRLTIDEEGNRSGIVFIDKGENAFSGSSLNSVIFKPLPSTIKPQPVEEIKPKKTKKAEKKKEQVEASVNETPLEKKKRELKEKLRQQDEALRNSNQYQQGANDIQFYGKREVANSTQETVNQAELDWFVKTFSKSFTGENASREFKLTTNLINSNLWGRFSEYGVKLVKDAPQGTLYHEAFHEFSQMYLTLSDKKRLYENARSSISGLSTKSDFEVEEYLADQFRNYVLENGNLKISDVTKSFFKRMLDYIKSIFFGPQTIESVFDRLYKGKINNYNPSINNILFKRLNAGITNSIGDNLFDATKSITVVKSIDRIIYDFIYSYDKSIVDVLSQPKIIQAAYKYAYKIFSDKLIELRNSFMAQMDEVSTEEELETLESNLTKQSDKFQRIITNWNDIITYHQNHSKTFIIKGDNIYFTYDDEGNIVEENDDSALEKPKNSFDSIQGNEISSIDGASKETKALIRGLAKTQFNEFGIQELVDFGPTWNNLAINLAGIMEYSQMLTKLDQLSNAFPEYKELLFKLGTNKPKDSLTTNQISQIAKFRQDFSKPYIGIYETVFDPVNQIYRVLEATKNSVSAIEDDFTNAFISSEPTVYITRDKYGANILNDKIRDLKIGTLAERVLFLKAIGVNLSEGTIKDPRAENVISGKAIAAIKGSLLTLIGGGIPVVNPLGQIRLPNTTLKLMGESGNIDAILKLESVYNRNNASASMLNAEGSAVYALSLNNFLTISNYYLSNAEAYPTYQDVIAQPHMAHLDVNNNSYIRNSIWLNNMFILDVEDGDPAYGTRRRINGEPITLDIINYNGLKVEQDQGASEGSTTTNLWIGDKLVQDFNSLLTSGIKEMMRAGDKSSAFAIKINGYRQLTGRPGTLPINIDLFANGWGGVQTLNIFSGYLVDELTRMQQARFFDLGSNIDYYKKTSKDFNLFRDILPDSIRKEIEGKLTDDTDVTQLAASYQTELKNALRAYFETQVNNKIASFTKYQFSLSSTEWVDSKLKSQYGIDQLLKAYVVNSFILNVEQTKIFNGDGAFYKAFHKRNSKDTSTGTTMMTDQWFLDWLNQNANTNLQSKILGVNNPVNNITNTVIFKDNIVPSAYINLYREQLSELGLPKNQIEDILSKYETATEGDAQGWITLDFYRTFKLAQGKWYPQHEVIYQKASRGEQLTTDEMFYFMPIKAQYAGPLQFEGAFAPAFHKFSLVPLLPSVIKGTKMEALNEKMIRNNVGYGLFESGSKVATILDSNGNKESFYQNYEDRTAISPTESFGAINSIFNHYLKEQVNIEPSLHDEVIFGTQFRKLLFQNLFNKGQAIDEKWDKLYQEYSHVLDQLIYNEKQRLLEELGMEETETGYKNVDFIKLVDKFLKEAKRRDMNENVQSFMEYDKSKNSFKYPLDASANRQQIQNMIMSILNNRLVRQHMKGDLMVQVSGTGFEKYQKPTDAQLAEYGTNGLRFYHLKNGKTQAMQVKVALTGDFANLLYFTHNDGQPVETIERLNEMLKSEEWMDVNRKAVTMVGYRIPTQGLNSIEFMEIAEFLPPEAGNILILPTEIVIKAGSDFDIDKLSIFKPSIRTRTKGKLTTASYTEPKIIKLDKSLATQKDELKENYDPKLLELRNQMTQLSDTKYQDVKWYSELRNELKTKLNEDLTEAFDRILTLNHDLKHTELEITFLRADLSVLMSEKKIDPSMNDQEIISKQEELKVLNQQYQNLREELNTARTGLKSAKYTKAGLMEEANKIIANYYDQYYYKLNTVNDTYQNLLTEYKNKLEDLYSFKGGLQNRIIEIGREVLEDKTNFVQLITPNDTGLIKPMIADEGGIKQQNGYPLKTDYTGTSIYTEKTQEEKFLAGLVGKKALGIAAVNNTFTQLFQIIGLNLNNTYSIQNREAIQTSIRLLENQTGKTFDFSNSFDEKGILKSEFVSQMINAYVDVLNDDFIFYANAGLDVAPILFYMKNAGVSTEKMFYFINHPVIKYFITNIQATKSHVLKALHPEIYDASKRPVESGSFKNELYKALVGKSNKNIANVRQFAIDVAEAHPQIFTERYLKQQVPKDIKQISYDERAAVLGHFLQLQEQAEILRKFQAANSYDTSPAATPVDSENFNQLSTQVNTSKLIDSSYQAKMGKTVIQAYNVTEFISDVFNTLMPISLSKNMVNYMLTAFEQIQDREKFVRLFTNDLLSYVFSNYVQLTGIQGSPNPADYIYGTENRDSLNKFTIKVVNGKRIIEDNRLAKRIRALKNNVAFEQLRQEFPIISALRVQELDKQTGFTNITVYRGENNVDTQNSLIEQFSRLANFNDPRYEPKLQLYVKKLFRDLALFGFIQSGLNKSPISFTDIIPNELYTPMVTRGLLAFQDDIAARGFETVIKEYSNKFSKNNPELFSRTSKLASYRYKDYRNANITIDQPSNLALPVAVKTASSNIKFEVSTTKGYVDRTTKNAAAPVTIAIATDFTTAGEKLTKNQVIKQNNTYIPIDINNNLDLSPELIKYIATFIAETKEGDLEINIAGNGIYSLKDLYTQEQLDEYVYDLLTSVQQYLEQNTKTRIGSIRSGGQTGLDEAGAKAGSRMGLPTIILAPKGWTFRNIAGKDISNEQAFKARFENIQQDPIQGTLFYGGLENRSENRIFNSRNSYLDNEVQEVLSIFEEQSKPCNS